MKLKTTSRSNPASSGAGSPPAGFKKPAGPAWAMVDSASREEALAAQAALNAPRAPETWVGEDETKRFRLLMSAPVAGIFQYRLQVRGKWRQFTKPARGEPDLFASELGAAATYRAVWVVLDYAGYTDKEGKKHENIARYWVTSGRLAEQLDAIAQEMGPLTEYDLKVKRIGTGQNTTYQIFPLAKSKLDPKIQRTLPNLAADFAKYYAPPTEDQQEAIVAAHRMGGGSE